jgi:hypothetical protein
LSSHHPLERRHGDTHPQFVDVLRAAEILDVSASFLNKARISGDGPRFAKFGHSVRYAVPDLELWAAARLRTSTSDPGQAA